MSPFVYILRERRNLLFTLLLYQRKTNMRGTGGIHFEESTRAMSADDDDRRQRAVIVSIQDMRPDFSREAKTAPGIA